MTDRYYSPGGMLPTDKERAIIEARRARVMATFDRILREEAALIERLADHD